MDTDERLSPAEAVAYARGYLDAEGALIDAFTEAYQRGHLPGVLVAARHLNAAALHRLVRGLPGSRLA